MGAERFMRRTYAQGEPATEELSVPGLPIPIRIKRHPRARRMTLRVSQCRKGVVLTLPRACKSREAHSFITKNIRWIKQHLNALPEEVAFTNGAVIPVRGTPHELAFVGRTSGRGVVWLSPRQEAVDRFFEDAAPVRATQDFSSSTNHDMCKLNIAGDEKHAPRRLQDWLIKQARQDLTDRVAFHADRLGLTPKRITVRDQSSRWGSCSTTGALSFSWRLVLAPPDVLDYVAAHEVAHLREMNHSDRFWALVRQTMPEMDAAKSWLRQNGAHLHAYGN